MTNPHTFLAVIGGISIFVFTVRLILAELVRRADNRRTRRALGRLGSAHWFIVETDRWIRLGVVVMVLGVAAPVRSSPCGEERAAVKLGLDEDAKRIDTSPSETTISALVNLPRPSRIPESRRASEVERTVWHIDAQVTAYKLEADGDYHVVVDSDGRHMIVEIPAAECAAPGAWGGEVRSARAAFERMLSDRGMPMPGKKLHRTSIPVRVNGVGFFDKLHGQTGVAGNGIELHPVLAIEVGGGV